MKITEAEARAALAKLPAYLRPLFHWLVTGRLPKDA